MKPLRICSDIDEDVTRLFRRIRQRDEPIICCADENEVLPRVATPVPPVPPVREPTYVDDVDDIVFL